MTTLRRESPAKVNLTLRVTGVRADGFHELESLVALVDFCDTVTVSKRADDQVQVACDDPAIPCDASNLAHRAATRLAEVTGAGRGADITLTKRIPAGAGLGGGSSNAATTLALLNELWETNLSDAELARIGASIGSDVPLFFSGPLCVLRGRGEQVERIYQRLRAWIVLILPGIHCSTPEVYRGWDKLSDHPPRPVLAEVLSALDRPHALMRSLFNDLEAPVLALEPMLAEAFSDLVALRDGPVRMTGSGSALYCLFRDEEAANAFAQAATDNVGLPAIATCIVPAEDA